MAIQQDFLMRVIEKLAAAFFRIIAGKVDDEPAEAIREIENALAEALNTRRETLYAQPPDLFDDFDARLAAQVGRMFALHATLSARLGRKRDMERSLRMAIAALRKGLVTDVDEAGPIAADTLDELLEGELPLPLDEAEVGGLFRDLFEYNVALRRWADAEDHLFHALRFSDDADALRRRGIRFYDMLLELDDEDLDEGGLPRDEVVEAREDLMAPERS